MSFDLSVHLATERMPSPQQWQAAITKHGFPLKISRDFDVVALSGSLPCEYQGQPCGFEYYYSILSQEGLQKLGISESFPCQILFSTSARPKEDFLSEIIAAAVLAEMTGGLLVDPQAGSTIEGAKAVEWCRKHEKSYRDAGANPRAQTNRLEQRRSGWSLLWKLAKWIGGDKITLSRPRTGKSRSN
jgi:hypothetical protein